MGLTVKDIDVEESDECQTKLSAIFRDVPLLDRQRMLDGVEGDHFLEEIESGVSERGVGEICNGRGTGPGDDGDEEDTGNDGTLHAVHHQHDREKAAAEDADPHSRAPHLVCRRANTMLVK